MKDTLYDKNFILSKKHKKNILFFLKKIILIYHDLSNIFLSSKKIERKKYYLSICSIFKDEAEYLVEWIEYHTLLGVEHFYMYNNFSSDDYKEILKPFIDKELVTLIEWPVDQGQQTAYKHCFENFSRSSNWITCIDIDEFFVPKYRSSISEWLKEYEKFPSLLVYWKVFGTSGHIKKPKGLVTENFFYCWNKMDDVGKIFFNTKFTVKDYSLHHLFPAILNGKTINPINEYKKTVRFNIHRVGNKECTMQLNHYWSKSFEEYNQKKAIKGDVFYSDLPKSYDYFISHEVKCNSYDNTIQRFLIPLKTKMNVV